MDIIEKAYKSLYPEREYKLIGSLSYSGHFKDYNANVRYLGNKIEFKLSKKWKTISEEIVIGLLQELMCKVFKLKRNTQYIDMYHKFTKNLHLAVPKVESDPILEDSFNRVNEKYFYGVIEKPNLTWGNYSTTQLGTYDFNSDRITISKIFMHADRELLDYIMYHEMLHKRHKFKSNSYKISYHSGKFKKEERMFEDLKSVEKKLNIFLNKVKVKRFFFGRI